jgi:GrpB-like predicted nucleotidyltransferase (UPF0157 family)
MTNDSIGLERGVVRLSAYDPEWPRMFELEKLRLQNALGGQILDIQHVGSTAVPGCTAKPILDILIAVESFEAAFACVPLIEGLGYEFRGELGIPRRHYFVKRDPRSTHHIHMFEPTSPDYVATLIFRDYLRTHPEAVEQYVALKQRLAEQYPQDREAYTDGKTEFVTKVCEWCHGKRANPAG